MSTAPPSSTDDAPSNVLLLAPPIGSQEDEVCVELLRSSTDERPHAVFCCLRSSASRLAVWNDRVGAESTSTTVVDVDASARSAAASAGPSTNVTVEAVSDPTDLLEIGKTLIRTLRRNGETALCLHSLTDLVQYTDAESVFKLLDVLTDAVVRADAVAHYHLDPGALDDQTLETLEVQFDAVVDLRDARDREERS